MPLSTALYTLLIPLILKRWLLSWFLRAWTSSAGFGTLYKWTHTLCTLFIWLVWCNIMIFRFIYLIVCSWRLSILRVGLYDNLFVHSVWIRVWVISRAVGTFKYVFLLIKCVCVSLRSCAQECNCWGITLSYFRLSWALRGNFLKWLTCPSLSPTSTHTNTTLPCILSNILYLTPFSLLLL